MLQPTSEGSVHAISAYPQGSPVIHANWLNADHDHKAAIASVRHMGRFMARPALSGKTDAELLHGDHVQSEKANLESFCPRPLAAFTALAPAPATWAATRFPLAKRKLRVRCVDGLRIADCSIMPALLSFNTNAPAMAEDWRAADSLFAQRLSLTPDKERRDD